jgi:hypothetical protein
MTDLALNLTKLMICTCTKGMQIGGMCDDLWVTKLDAGGTVAWHERAVALPIHQHEQVDLERGTQVDNDFLKMLSAS